MTFTFLLTCFNVLQLARNLKKSVSQSVSHLAQPVKTSFKRIFHRQKSQANLKDWVFLGLDSYKVQATMNDIVQCSCSAAFPALFQLLASSSFFATY